MHRARWLLAAPPILLALACYRAPRVASAFPEAAEEREYPQGTFAYDVTALGQLLRGRVTIVDTLVIVEPVDDSCGKGVLAPDWRQNPIVRIGCRGGPVAGLVPGQGSTVILIHLQYPQSRSRWGRIERVEYVDVSSEQDRLKRCIDWGADRFGRRFCRLYDDPPPNQTRRVPVWEWGSLPLVRSHVIRADTGQRTMDPAPEPR